MGGFMTLDVFLSVGSTKREDQISFVKAIEEHLDNIGLRPRALDRTDYFDSGLPLNDTTDLMRECSGAVVIAFERKFIREGVEKRYHPREEQTQLADVKIC